jgi:hypothetical protein
VKKRSPLEGDLVVEAGCRLVGRLVLWSVFVRSVGVAIEAADHLGPDVPGRDRLVERFFGGAAFHFDLIGFAAEGALDLDVRAFQELAAYSPNLPAAST